MLRPGASRSSSAGHDGVDRQHAAEMRNGVFSPTLVNSFTVVSALIAVPPMPAPKMPTASPVARAGTRR